MEKKKQKNDRAHSKSAHASSGFLPQMWQENMRGWDCSEFLLVKWIGVKHPVWVLTSEIWVGGQRNQGKTTAAFPSASWSAFGRVTQPLLELVRQGDVKSTLEKGNQIKGIHSFKTFGLARFASHQIIETVMQEENQRWGRLHPTREVKVGSVTIQSNFTESKGNENIHVYVNMLMQVCMCVPVYA